MLLRKTLSIALISLLFVLEAAAQSAGSFKISEVVVGNTNGLVDEYGNRPSWIEVANTSWGTVNLQNCYLTNNRKAVEDMPVRERVKLMSLISRGDSRTKLEAQERIVFFADGCTNLGTLHTNFKLVPGKENFIALFDGNARTLLDSVTVSAEVPAGYSYARVLSESKDGYTWCITPPGNVTPGSANNSGTGREDKVAEFKENDPYGFGMAILGMGIVFSCLISLYVFFHIFGYFFKKRNESRKEGNATAESGENGNVVSAESLREVYMAVIALGLNRAMGNHDEESGIITIKSCRSNWNPRISG